MQRSVPAALGVVLLGLASALASEPSSSGAPPGYALQGEWLIDLRPTPADGPYSQTMVPARDEQGEWGGSFYGTPLANVTINTDWGEPRIAFTTQDQTTLYVHSARLSTQGREVPEGRTHALGRGFLAMWTAERQGTVGSDQP
jgi:hypothetical protein